MNTLPAKQPKVNISARLELTTLLLLQEASAKTGKTQSALVDECVVTCLTPKLKKGAKK